MKVRALPATFGRVNKGAAKVMLKAAWAEGRGAKKDAKKTLRVTTCSAGGTWNTHGLEVPVLERECRFESCAEHWICERSVAAVAKRQTRWSQEPRNWRFDSSLRHRRKGIEPQRHRDTEKTKNMILLSVPPCLCG